MDFNFLKRKDDQRLPDSYKMTFRLGARETLVYEVASHIIIDKIFVRDSEGRVTQTMAHPSPYWELTTTENLIVVVPASLPVEFDLNWSKIVEIREEQRLAALKAKAPKAGETPKK